MNLYKNQIFSAFLALLLALPAIMFLKLPSARGNNFSSNEVYSGIRVVTFSPQGVKVIIANHPASFSEVPGTAASNSFLAGICLSSPAPEVLPLQDPGLINLNQPASCFSLKLSTLNFQKELKVVTGHWIQPAAVVVVNKSFIESVRIFPAFPVQEKAVMVFYFLLLNLGFAVAAGVIKRGKPAGLKNFVPLLSIFELKVLRC